MEPIRTPSRAETAIPVRFGCQRERVLELLTRWEQSTRSSAQELSESSRHLFLQPQEAGPR